MLKNACLIILYTSGWTLEPDFLGSNSIFAKLENELLEFNYNIQKMCFLQNKVLFLSLFCFKL